MKMKFKRATDFPFFLIESHGKFINLSDWEEIALLVEVFSSMKDDFILTKIFYPFIFIRLEENAYLGFDGFRIPEYVQIPVLDLDISDGEKWATEYSTLVKNLGVLLNQIKTAETTKSEMISPLPPAVLQAFSILIRKKFESYPLSRINLLDLWWDDSQYSDIDPSTLLSTDFLSLIEEPMTQISSFLNFLAHIIPEWLQIAKEEDNRLQDAVPEVSEYDQVMRQSLNEVIAYYEDVIANLRQEIAELKMSKEAKKHSELSIAALLETEEVSEKEDERSCKDKLMDTVQSIRDTLNNLKRELEGLSLIFDKAYAVKVFSESIHLVSVPFFLLVPREGEKTFESYPILYPSILSAQRRYRGEGFDNFVFSSPIGLHIKEALQQKEVSPSIIQEAVQGWDFFEFKHKPFVDVGKQGLRKRNLIE